MGHLIRNLGGDWKKFEDRRFCPHCRTLIYRVDNKPFDGLGVIQGHAFPVEIKSAKLSFPFADIEEHQREGLDAWTKKHTAPTWLALQMGTGRAGSQDSNLPRRLWLIPWASWKMIERLVNSRTGLVSLPYDCRYGRMRLAVKEHEAAAVQMLETYELLWVKGAWALPEEHVFRSWYHIKE